MKHQVQKTFSTCTAHRLMNHPGACRNLHGHNYNITVHIEADQLNDQGMVMDFGSVKQLIGMYINKMYDHKTVLQDTDELADILAPVMEMGSIVTMPCPPTAENMAEALYKGISTMFIGTCEGFRLARVDVEETATSIAVYVG